MCDVQGSLLVLHLGIIPGDAWGWGGGWGEGRANGIPAIEPRLAVGKASILPAVGSPFYVAHPDIGGVGRASSWPEPHLL